MSPTPTRNTNLQLYFQETLWNRGLTTDWRDYLLALRRQPLSITQMACTIYAQLGIRLDPTTLSRWLREAEAAERERGGAEDEETRRPA